MMFPTTFGSSTISAKVGIMVKKPTSELERAAAKRSMWVILDLQGLMKICRSGCAYAMLVVVVVVVV